MAAYYSSQEDTKPPRRSHTPFPRSSSTRPSSLYASAHSRPSSPSSLNNLMASPLFPSLLKQNPDRPLIINLGTLNLSDASSSGRSDDASLGSTTGVPAARYTYAPSSRSSSYYYRPSSYSASFAPRERPEAYVQYARPRTARGRDGLVMTGARGSGGGGGGLYLSPASSRGRDSRGSSTSYYGQGKLGEYYYPRQGGSGYGQVEEREYCGGCSTLGVLDDTGLCEECVYFVPKTAGRGRRDVGGGARRDVGYGERAGFEGVRYVDSERGGGRRKRSGSLGREVWESKGSYAGSVYYGGMDE